MWPIVSEIATYTALRQNKQKGYDESSNDELMYKMLQMEPLSLFKEIQQTETF